MSFQETVPKTAGETAAPFLPLAFRLAASFGLIVLHLALPWEGGLTPPGEGLYLAILTALFVESVWEVHRAIAAGRKPFAQPRRNWIRLNLLLDIALITLLIAFHGVDQERLATIYIFPVLASAFYLNIYGIAAVGLLSSICHIACVLLFTQGVLPDFGLSGPGMEVETYQVAYILGFASLQIFGATLVVVVIRSHMESLHTNLSRSEATVDELSALYRRVFESMFSGLITSDLAGRITSANPAAEKILHTPLVPGNPLEPFGFGNLENLGTFFREQRFEVNFQSPDGARRIVGGNVAPLLGSEGEPTGHLLVFQDLTDLKALEERTRMSERLAAVGELSSEMAHELRNPLASILGCVQILKQGEQAKPMMDRILTILFRESQRVSALVTEFLDFTRPRPMRLEAIPLKAVADEVRASWETDPRNAGLDLRMEALPEARILGDKVWVHQIFTNLLSNARKALKGVAAPVIRVSFGNPGSAPGPHGGSTAGPQGGQVLATVTDNGCGMSEERLKAVFIPFSSGFEEGTGLGMSLVFQFVQQMGWGIQVDSTPGAGTTVTLRIPTAPEPAGGVENEV